MSHDEFTKLFKYMEEWFRHINLCFDVVDTGIRNIKFTLGELAGQIKASHQEL